MENAYGMQLLDFRATFGQLLGFRVFPITLESHLDELPDSSRLRHRANSATSANPSKSSTFS